MTRLTRSLKGANHSSEPGDESLRVFIVCRHDQGSPTHDSGRAWISDP